MPCDCCDFLNKLVDLAKDSDAWAAKGQEDGARLMEKIGASLILNAAQETASAALRLKNPPREHRTAYRSAFMAAVHFDHLR